MRCENCRFRGPFYVPADRGSEEPEFAGEQTFSCRRHAPIATGGMMSPSQRIWPWVRNSDWCGEFEPTQEVK